MIIEGNTIYNNDNLKILRSIEDESVDLIYLDPPFFTKKTIKREKYQFSDNWKDINEYLSFMKIRLIEMCRILKITGSIYLHIDHHVLFELKPIMDEIFGGENFRNHIIWTYNSPGGSQGGSYSKKHDDILFYTKTYSNTFNTERIPYQSVWSKRTKHLYHPGGKTLSDSWVDIGFLSTKNKERTGYPTQKPESLLERIIKVSSDPGDSVLDPFCGSGTTCVVAKKLGRNYIGVDEKIEAVEISRGRMVEPISVWEW